MQFMPGKEVKWLLGATGPRPPGSESQLAGGNGGQSEPKQTAVATNLQEQKEAERQDREKEFQLEDLMENVKRYIRNIDVGNL